MCEYVHLPFQSGDDDVLKEMKRGNQPMKADETEVGEEENGHAASANALANPPAKKPRHEYAIFKNDVERLQKKLSEFEHDLREHSHTVQLKLASILRALDEGTPVNLGAPSALGAPAALGAGHAFVGGAHAHNSSANGAGTAGGLAGTQPPQIGTAHDASLVQQTLIGVGALA